MKSALITYFIAGSVFLALDAFFVFFLLPLQHRKRYQKPYSFLREFPFELIEWRENRLPSARFVVLLGSIAFFGTGGYFLSMVSISPSFLGMAIMVLVMATLSAVGFSFLFFVKAFHVKSHMFSMLIFGFASILFDVMSIIAFLHFDDHFMSLKVLFSCLLGLFALIKLVLLINPKLKDWAKLDSSIDQTGAVIHSRPKIFLIATTEWTLIVLHFLSALFSMLAFFLLILPLI